MARTQTLVQLTDELLEQLDGRAAREGRSRSELIRDAVSSYLDDDREAELDRQLVEGYTREPQTVDELALTDAATREMLATAGPWDADDE